MVCSICCIYMSSYLFYFYAKTHDALGLCATKVIVRIDRVKTTGLEDSDEESLSSSLSDYINDIR